MAIVAANNYDAVIASFWFLLLGEFVMAWKVYLPTGTVEVGSADLKRMAADGTISKTTQIESTTNKVRTTAAGIAGLVFKAEDVNLLDLPIPEVPQTPPTWNPPLEQTSFREPEWIKKPTYTQEKPKGFFGALFDTSFSSMWTPTLLGVIWVVAVIASGCSVLLLCVGFAISLAVQGSTREMNIAWASSLLAIMAGIIVIRVTLETIAVIFKICEYLKNINDRG